MWDVVDGLPVNTVTSLVLSRDGFLWIGTFGGLARFDGTRFRVSSLTNTPELPSNRILSLLETRDGELWIGTLHDGAAKWSSSGDLERFEPGVRSPTGPIWSIVQGPDGSVWVGGAGLSRTKPSGETQLWPDVESLPATSTVRHLLFDPRGTLWIAAHLGVVRFRNGEFQRLEEANQLGIPWRFAEDAAGRVWVLGVKQCGIFDGDELLATCELGLSPPISSAWSDGELVVGDTRELRTLSLRPIDTDTVRAGSAGAGSVDARPTIRVDREPSSVSIRSILIDPESGDLLCGTSQGLMRRSKRLRLLEASGVPVGPAATDGDLTRRGAWTAANRRVVSRRADGTAGPRPPNIRGRLRAALTDSAGRDCFVSDRELVIRSGALVERYSHDFGYVNRVFESSDAALWFTSDLGLVRFSDGTAQIIEPTDDASSAFDSMAESPDGAIWVTNRTSVRRVLPGCETSVYTHDDGVPRGEIRSVHVDIDGTVWFTSYGGGLCQIRDGRVFRFGRAHGLIDESLGCVLEDDNSRLWINSNRGILVVSREDLNAVADGRATHASCRPIVSPECHGGDGFRDDSGMFWMSTVAGAVVADPRQLVSNERGPSIRVESVTIDSKSFEPSPQISAGPLNGRLEIEYTAISFVHAELIAFRYQLVGYDEDWIDAGHDRTAVYTKVPPGTYEFRLKARNADGVWSETETPFRLTLDAPFYRQNWFWIALSIAAAAALWLSHRRRLSKIETHNVALQHEIQERERAEFGKRELDEALRQSEECYRAVYETAPIAFVVWNRNCQVVEWNERAERTFGWSAEEVIGRNFFEFLIPPDARLTVERVVNQLRSDKLPSHAVNENLTKSGRRIVCDWTNSVYRDANGEVRGGISLAVDITESHSSRRMLQELRRRLAQAEETERCRIARELHDDLTQRVAAMAVELSLVENEHAAQHLGQIRENLEAIASDVHRLSRRLHPTIIDDLGLVRAIASECDARSRDGFVVDFVPGELPEVPTDVALACYRITQEAIGNASRHANADSVHVTLAWREANVLLRIEDDGEGLPHDTTNQSSLGLGLASMRERVMLLDGKFSVVSTPGEGTSIEAKIPVPNASVIVRNTG